MHSPRAAGSGRRTPPPRRRLLTGTVAGATGLALMVAPGSVAQAVDQAAAQPAAHRAAGPITALASSSRLSRDFDVRDQGSSAAVLTARARKQNAHPTAVVRSLRSHLGVQGVLSLDPLTGTPRTVAKLDGYLTGPSSRTPSTVVLDYVRSHLGAFGLDRTDLGTLRLRRTYTDVSGIRHLSYVQYSGSVPVFGNGLKANVSRNGRLVSVQGSPVHDLADVGSTPGWVRRRLAGRRSGTCPARWPRSAPEAAAARPGLTRFSDGDRASLVAFQTVTGPRLAWQTLTTPGRDRCSCTWSTRRPAWCCCAATWCRATPAPSGTTGPGAATAAARTSWTSPLPAGCRTRRRGWPATSHTSGPTSTTTTLAQPREEVHAGHELASVPVRRLHAQTDGPPCTAASGARGTRRRPTRGGRTARRTPCRCSTTSTVMHDHLLPRPIGFNRRGRQLRGDRRRRRAGASPTTARTPPTACRTRNHSTTPTCPPRRTAFRRRCRCTCSTIRRPTRTGPVPAVQRRRRGRRGLPRVHPRPVQPAGRRRPASPPSAPSRPARWVRPGATGTPWTTSSTRASSATPRGRGDLRVGEYVGKGNDLIRSQPIDCPVAGVARCAPARRAPGPAATPTATSARSPAVPRCTPTARSGHETLWDLRKALGSKLTESLVTRAMELSPANPSFLDMRNSILLADPVVNGGGQRDHLEGVRAPGHGLLRRRRRRRRHHAGGGLLPPPRGGTPPAPSPARSPTGHRRRGRGCDGRVRWPRLRVPRRLRGRHRHRWHYRITGFFPAPTPRSSPAAPATTASSGRCPPRPAGRP